MSDPELLQRYTRDHSQSAFAALVARHVDLVYSAARRQIHSPQLAEEVAQSVFVELARHAPKIPPAQPLAAWLYVVTRRTAIDAVRRESRRLARETTAAEIAAMKTPSEAWMKVEASIDEAMATLNDTERTALVLRFFQNLSLREVGEALGISEDTAQKRVSRALERLRTAFLRRGVAVTATGLATDLSAQALQIAPTGLGAAISLLAPTAAAPHGLAIATTKMIAMTTAQKTIVATTLVLAIGVGLHQARTISDLRRQNRTLQQRTDGLLAQIRQIRQQQAEAGNRLAAADRELATSRAHEAASAMASAEQDAPMNAELKAIAARVLRFKERLAKTPEQQIPELRLLTDRDWIDAVRKFAASDKDDDIWEGAVADLRESARAHFAAPLQHALEGYLRANYDQLPVDIAQLAPFFNPPVDGALLQRYQMLARGRLAGLSSGTMLIGERELLPGDYAGIVFSRGATADITWHSGGESGELYTALIGFAAANGGAWPGDALQLTPYFKSPVEPAKLRDQWARYRNEFPLPGTR
jgi:RNA polymerase sigma factor (sigma-70 family)